MSKNSIFKILIIIFIISNEMFYTEIWDGKRIRITQSVLQLITLFYIVINNNIPETIYSTHTTYLELLKWWHISLGIERE